MNENTTEFHEGMSDYLAINNYEKKRYAFIANFFKEKMGGVLDVGCCRGGLKKYIHPNLTYWGVDNLHNDFENYIKVDLNSKQLPFEDKKFDAINCSAVLEHLFYPLELLREMKRVLKNDGVILISLPNDKSLNAIYAQLFVRFQEYEKAVSGHHWRFSIKTARQFFEQEFKIIQEVPEFGPLFRRYLPFLKFKSFCTEWFILGVKKDI